MKIIGAREGAKAALERVTKNMHEAADAMEDDWFRVMSGFFWFYPRFWIRMRRWRRAADTYIAVEKTFSNGA